jgi:hypothetical protein
VTKVVLVIDVHRFDHWAEVETEIRSQLTHGLQLEVAMAFDLYTRQAYNASHYSLLPVRHTACLKEHEHPWLFLND